MDGELDRSRDGVGRALERRPQEPPEFATPRREDAQGPDAAGENAEAARAPVRRRLGLADRRHEVHAAVVVRLRIVELGEQLAVAFEERPLVHRGLEVGAIELVAVRRDDAKPSLLRKPPGELRSGQGGQDADHGDRHRERGDEAPLQLEDFRSVAVEADDEAGIDLEARRRDEAHRLVGRLSEVL